MNDRCDYCCGPMIPGVNCGCAADETIRSLRAQIITGIYDAAAVGVTLIKTEELQSLRDSIAWHRANVAALRVEAESWRQKLFACGDAADGVFHDDVPDPKEINLGRVRELFAANNLLHAQVAELRVKACRFYRADGTFEVLASAAEVIERRKAAAARVAELEAEVARLQSEIRLITAPVEAGRGSSPLSAPKTGCWRSLSPATAQNEITTVE